MNQQRRIEQEPPSAPCVHCGKRIEARTEPGDDVSPRKNFEQRYTHHVTEVHDLPATAAEAARR